MTFLTSQNLRRIILEQSKRAHVGHIGSSLSIVEILISLYRDIIHAPDGNCITRDRFILSKGHAALALYGILHLMGLIPKEILDTYCGNHSLLGVHPHHTLQGIDFSTGSLGQGISYAVGAALAARLQNSKRRIFVLISDGECNEGVVWEAAMFAAQHKLAQLTVIVDDNKQQALGYTKDVLSLHPLAEKWKAFGWNTYDVDGHDKKALSQVISGMKTSGAPHVIIARTIFGKGVSFMENRIAWHYLPMSNDQYACAFNELSVQ